MNTDELLAATEKLIEEGEDLYQRFEREERGLSRAGFKAKTRDFLRVYGGAGSSFYDSAMAAKSAYASSDTLELTSILRSFRDYIDAGLHAEISPERRAQIDVVSDILEQAQTLLADSQVHPAAPTMLLGAALEEFLRTWVESIPLAITGKSRGLSAYGAALRKAGLITKQDMKDLTSWGGIRNHAAHGEWDQVSDRKRVALALEGVNLFMRRYGA